MIVNNCRKLTKVKRFGVLLDSVPEKIGIFQFIHQDKSFIVNPNYPYPKAWDELQEWQVNNRKLWVKISEFINDSRRTPFEGKGKPEPLKANYRNYFSRRINEEHRLIYKVTDEAIIIVSCKGHYE